MGVPRLNIKKELHYRKGNLDARCGDCIHFEPNPEPLGGFRAVADGRCRIIGLKPGRAYQVLPHYVCRRFERQNQ